VRWRHWPSACPTCASCVHFVDDPQALESRFAGIGALSSAFGSTRGRDGICLRESTFHDPEPACPSFTPRVIPPAGVAEPASARLLHRIRGAGR
jgi:hypothetical protein